MSAPAEQDPRAATATLLSADALQRALDARADLNRDHASELSTCYRLFHGAVEGRPGLTLDRYGPVLLAQTWNAALHPEELAVIEASAGDLRVVYNHRDRPVDFDAHFPVEPFEAVGTELGMTYDVRPRHRGQDPLLFLDFRAARRRVRLESRGKSVLNLFAYTCTMGQVAHTAGADYVLNIDFASSALDVGRANVARNDPGPGTLEFFQSDCLPAIWQLAGKSLPRRRGRAPYLAPHRFDIVVLDPPRFAKSRFGTVDVVGDYPTLLKPCLQIAAPGGVVLATNHVPQVSLDEWLEVVRRTAAKVEREIRSLEVITPEADFPSFDGSHPLKMAWIQLD
ncbi:MAG: class I SAM-dependent methyltransferase [Planctomycetota bacterium]